MMAESSVSVAHWGVNPLWRLARLEKRRQREEEKEREKKGETRTVINKSRMQIKAPSERAAPAVRRSATTLKRAAGGRGEERGRWGEACEHGVDADRATDSECSSHDLFNAPVRTRASVDDGRKIPRVPFSAGARMNILTCARARRTRLPSKYPRARLEGAR